MESLPDSFSAPTPDVPDIPLTMRSTSPTRKSKKISAAAAAGLAAAATATVKYDRWERVPREQDHMRQAAQDKKLPYESVLRGVEMGDTKHTMINHMRIDAAHITFDNMKQIEKDQSERKLRLWEEIEKDENHTWENANELLRKYARLKSGMVRITKNFRKDFDHEQVKLINMKESSESKIKDIEDELTVLDSLLETQNTEYTELLHYKLEQYPLKVMVIEGLEEDIEEIRKENEIEEKEIEYVMSSEMERYRRHKTEEVDSMAKMISEMSFDLMPPPIKKLMLENLVMQKEIKFHLRAKKEMNEQVKSLTEEIKQLSQSNFRMKIFPEFFPKENKCNPDLDIVLDIPHKTFLPI